ncbi:type VI secretion system-associated protein TagO [Xenorhabdus bovienii]|uniref:type VI secretion system-associated protein TagO n=1 Tax=Xenorhabdus bovienii TaxID=40576 RepID=UPI003DA34DC4
MENMGLVWRQAMEQEMKRTDYSTGFIVTQGENGEAPVILTTPAVGGAASPSGSDAELH